MSNFDEVLFCMVMADDMLSNRKVNSILTAKINENILNEKDRYICKRKLIDGLTFEKIAEEIDMSIQQTKTRFYNAKKLLNIS